MKRENSFGGYFFSQKYVIVIARYRVQYRIFSELNIYTKNLNEENIPYCTMF